MKDIRYMKLTWIFKNRINFVARWFPRIKAYTCKKNFRDKTFLEVSLTKTMLWHVNFDIEFKFAAFNLSRPVHLRNLY